MCFKKFILLLFVLPLAAAAQDTALIKKQAERFAKATFTGDYNTIIDYTYPKLVELSGGRVEMQKLIAERIANLKKQGVVGFDGSVELPGPIYKAGSQLHCLLPENIILKTRYGRYMSRSYLLAISEDKGKIWTFMDVGNIPPKVLRKLLPDYNIELLIPAPVKPEFLPN
ncbi:hypothetical protein EWM62_04630 [Mucilaginibacter terrigena]|uniref:DUF4251 domain-containing protein n=1 Tax=Mucilaginibacter terrigena TaxID=2492395 RepID=A0A4V1ZC30_9SPHI|nr:hypothetical protein [Mucilaginibacter terrigena]RYU91230.1 hypothetical protein EWM62_04630 [Mucilaginibacter terrigena]